MPAAAIVTLVAAGVVVLVLAGYLLYVGWMLQHVTRTLDGVVGGLEQIAKTSEPVGGLIDEINQDLTHVEASVDAVAAKLPRSEGDTALS
jgi:hypothetical protein